MIEELLDLKLRPYITKSLEKFEKKADKIMRQMARKIWDMRKMCHALGDATKHDGTNDQYPHHLTRVHGTAEDTAYGSESQQSRRTPSNTPQNSEKSSDDSESILCQSPVMATDGIDENFNGNSSRNVHLPQPCTSPPTSQPSSGKKSSDSEQIACEAPREATGSDNESQLAKESYALGYAPMHEEPVSHGLSLQDTAFKQDALQTGALPQPSAPTQKLPLQLPTLQSSCQSPTPQSPCQSLGEKSLNEATTGIDNGGFCNIRSSSQHTILTCPSTVLAREPEVRRSCNYTSDVLLRIAS